MNFLKTLSALLIFSFLFISCGQEDYDRIIEVGIVGKGIIDKVEDTNVTVNEDPQVRLYLTVYSKDKDPFKADIKMVVSRVSIPRKGDWVAVKYDPVDNTKVIWIEDDDMTPEVEEQLKQI